MILKIQIGQMKNMIQIGQMIILYLILIIMILKIQIGQMIILNFILMIMILKIQIGQMMNKIQNDQYQGKNKKRL